MTASVRDPDATDPGARVDPRRARAATWGVVTVVLGTGAYLLVGPHGPLWLLLLLLAAGYAGFAALVWGGRNEGALSRRAVLVATAVLFLLALANPPIESGDVWSYAMYGRMVSTYHDNPYTHVPSDYPTDPVARRVTRIWKSTPSVYGPVFVATAAPGMWLVGTSALCARLNFQLLALLSVAAAMWLVYRWTGGSALALALVGLNPFVVVSVINGAHNDATVGLLVLAGILLAERGHLRWCAVVLAAAVAIKVAAVLCVIGLAVWLWRQRGWRAAVETAGGCLLVTAGLYLLGGGTVAVEPLQHASAQISWGSVWYLARSGITNVSATPGTPAWYASQRAARQLSLIASALAVGLAVLLVFRTRAKSNPPIVVGLAVFAYGLVGPYVLPWYLAWGLIPLALAYRSRSALALLFFAAVLHLGFVPDARAILHNQSSHGLAHSLQSTYIHWVVPTLEVVAVVAALVWTSSEARHRLRARWPRLPAHDAH